MKNTQCNIIASIVLVLVGMMAGAVALARFGHLPSAGVLAVAGFVVLGAAVCGELGAQVLTRGCYRREVLAGWRAGSRWLVAHLPHAPHHRV
jgi:hypothetical protein